MSTLLHRPDLALAALLVLALLWAGLAFWNRVSAVSGDVVGARLDALQPRYDFTHLPSAPAPKRDYSAERGPAPDAPARYASIYDELCVRLGIRPC